MHNGVKILEELEEDFLFSDDQVSNHIRGDRLINIQTNSKNWKMTIYELKSVRS